MHRLARQKSTWHWPVSALTQACSTGQHTWPHATWAAGQVGFLGGSSAQPPVGPHCFAQQVYEAFALSLVLHVAIDGGHAAWHAPSRPQV